MKNWSEIEQEQKEVCKRLGLPWTPVDNELMIAINNSLFTDIRPINGLFIDQHQVSNSSTERVCAT